MLFCVGGCGREHAWADSQRERYCHRSGNCQFKFAHACVAYPYAHDGGTIADANRSAQSIAYTNLGAKSITNTITNRSAEPIADSDADLSAAYADSNNATSAFANAYSVF